MSDKRSSKLTLGRFSTMITPNMRLISNKSSMPVSSIAPSPHLQSKSHLQKATRRTCGRSQIKKRFYHFKHAHCPSMKSAHLSRKPKIQTQQITRLSQKRSRMQSLKKIGYRRDQSTGASRMRPCVT